MNKDIDCLINKAFTLARKHHGKQVDKGGVDYVDGHLTAVYEGVKGNSNCVNCQVTAILHDILEDTLCTEREISVIFGDVVLESVKTLTKTKSEKYQDYLKRVKTNDIARLVKYWDLDHNRRLDRLKEVTDKDIKRSEKYLDAMAFLIGCDYGNIL